MRDIQIFEGAELQEEAPDLPRGDARCYLRGVGSQQQDIIVSLDDQLFSKHILLLGSIGTGKTNAIFQIVDQLRQHLTPEDVMLIFDTKGDFYEEFYRPGDIVISNDKHATGPAGLDFWNIFCEFGEGESVEENIFEITRTLFYEKIERFHQPFFPNAAKDLFSAILLHFHRRGEPHQLSNAHLRAFLDQTLSAELRSILASHDDLRAMTSYIADDRSPQTQGVFSELQQMTREILMGNFRREGTLSVRKAVRDKGAKAIFVSYDLGIGNILTPIYRLLLDLALKEALSRKKSEGNVWFIVDEFRLIPSLQHVDDGVNFGRSLGAKFIVGIQNIEQVFHAYGEPLARSILSAFTTTIAFRANDVTTRNYIQQHFGRNRKREMYMASVQSRGIVEQVREANVVEDWDITRLPVGQAIVGMPDRDPFLFQFRKYK